MVTQEQIRAMLTRSYHSAEFHYGTCKRSVGPRGGVRTAIERARPNGALRTWVTRPNEFRLPIKIGFKGHGYIDHNRAADWHTADDCPLRAPCTWAGLAHDCLPTTCLSSTTVLAPR